ncbi:hypothetical protein T484DRAFT_1854569 [Baffinella frigidus]|nr:hypothetical protein T484DRAFT_1854569 [Cryptophyta sp. CCMP2293]
MALDPSPQHTTAKGRRWDLLRVRLHEAQERMAPDPSPQRSTVKGKRWDLVRARLHAAQERHSFLATRSWESSTEVDALREEKKQHWTTVSQTLRFGSHFAKRRGSRRGSSVTFASPRSSMRLSSVGIAAISSRRGSITISSPRSILRQDSIKIFRTDKGRRSCRLAMTPRARRNASSPVAASSRKQVRPGALTVEEEEERTELDAPRWKQAWLRRKNAMEQGGGLKGTRCTTVLDRQPTGLVCTRHGARQVGMTKYGGGGNLQQSLAPDDSSQPVLECAEPGLAGLTSYYKYIKAKYPNAAAAAAFSPSSSSASTASSASSSACPTPTSCVQAARVHHIHHRQDARHEKVGRVGGAAQLVVRSNRPAYVLVK